jgi:uncharacterized protein YidB (DUF937 family)
MLENLFNLVKENAGDAIINNPAVPNEKNNAAIQTTTDSIMNGLKQQIAGGNLDSLTSLLSGQSNVASHPAVSNINQQVISDLMAKLGISNSAAVSIASSLVPLVLSKLVKKTNDPNDSSFDLPGILGSLGGGGNLGGLGGLIGGLFGK